MKTRILALSFCLAIGSSTEAGDVLVAPGFLTGNHLRRLSHDERHSYVIGVTDAFIASALVGASETERGWLERCAMEMESQQILSLVDKYLADNPGKWHLPSALLVYDAFNETCSGSPRKRKR